MIFYVVAPGRQSPVDLQAGLASLTTTSPDWRPILDHHSRWYLMSTIASINTRRTTFAVWPILASGVSLCLLRRFWSGRPVNRFPFPYTIPWWRAGWGRLPNPIVPSEPHAIVLERTDSNS